MISREFNFLEGLLIIVGISRIALPNYLALWVKTDACVHLRENA